MSKYKAQATERILPDEGMYDARVVGFIEMGTVETEYGDKFKTRISYELVDESAVFNEDKGEQNFVVHRKYNRSLGKRSDMGKDVRAIMGVKDFEDDEEIEMDELADMPCQVQVEHSEDGQWANVVKVVPIKKGQKVSKSENEFKSLFLDENFDEDVFDSLSEGMQDAIAESPEYKEITKGHGPKSKKKKRGDDDDEDERPRNKRRGKEDDDDEEEEDDRRSSRRSRDKDRPSKRERVKKKERPAREKKKPTKKPVKKSRR